MSPPALNRGYRLRHDPVRGTAVILAPERIITLDACGKDVLDLVDGTRTVEDIVDQLAARYDTPAATIRADVDDLLDSLAVEGAIRR